MAVVTAFLTGVGVLIAAASLLQPPVELKSSGNSIWIVVSPGFFGLNLFSGIGGEDDDSPASHHHRHRTAAANRRLRYFARHRAGHELHCVASKPPPHAVGAVSCRLAGRTLTYARFRTKEKTRAYFHRVLSHWRPLSTARCDGSSTYWTKPDGSRSGLFAFRRRGSGSSLTWTYEAARVVAELRGDKAAALCDGWFTAAL